MKDVAFVSVAFGERYVAQQDRLRESILAIYPDANIFFYRECLPLTSRSFYDSLYGFKPHAIDAAVKDGHSKIIWLDPAMILMDKVDDLLQYPVVAVKDDTKLCNVIADKYLQAVGVTREQVKENDWHLVGGSLYYLDFNTPIATRVFNKWQFDEATGMFGSQYEEASQKLQGHRADETCMAVNMYTTGIEPMPAHQVRYCIESNPMFVKKHFK